MRIRVVLAGIALAVVVAVTVSTMEAFSEESAKETYTFVGAKKCKMCHQSAKIGAQYKVWAAGQHAKAYEALASEEAVKAAKELGIDDPQKSDKCLKCHVTAFPVMADLENQKITLEEGVSCESCHGPGSGYYSKKKMEGIAAGEIKPESLGLVTPTEELCTGCHTKEGNPFHKEFKFDEYVKKIAHPTPTKEG